MSADGRRFVVGTTDGKMIVWDLQAKSESIFRVPTGDLQGVAISGNGERVVTSVSRWLQIWDVEASQNLYWMFGSCAREEVTLGLTFAADGTHFYGSGGQMWRRCRIANGRCQDVLNAPVRPGIFLGCVAIVPAFLAVPRVRCMFLDTDGKRAITACDENVIRIWTTE